MSKKMLKIFVGILFLLIFILFFSLVNSNKFSLQTNTYEKIDQNLLTTEANTSTEIINEIISTPKGEENNVISNNNDSQIEPMLVKKLKEISDSLYKDYLQDTELEIDKISTDKTINKLKTLDELCIIIQNSDKNDLETIKLRVNTNIQLAKLVVEQAQVGYYKTVVEVCSHGLSLNNQSKDNDFFTYYKAVGLLEFGKRQTSDSRSALLIESRDYFKSLNNYENYQKFHYLLIIGNLLYNYTGDIKYLEDSLITTDQVISLGISEYSQYSIYKELADSYFKVGNYYYQNNIVGKYELPFKQANQFIDNAKLITSQTMYSNQLDSLSSTISIILKEENND